MPETRVDFTDVRWTQLVTLYLRAVDARSPVPILGDEEAVAALGRIDHPFDARWMRATRGDRFMVCLRARTLDGWAREYLAAHPGATVVQLGCGLDSRAFRLRRPPGSRWFDVDLPDVVALRRRLYEETDDYRMIGCSVTDPGWLEAIPVDGPVLVVAEGLLMYLRAPEVAALLRRVVAAFGEGEVIADGMAPWVVAVSRLVPGRGRAFRQEWAVGDGHDVERMAPGLTLVETTRVVALGGAIAEPLMRWTYRVLDAVPGLRDTMRLFRFRFGG